MEQELLAPCGLDCAKCEARIATLTHDEALKKAVAERWSELNHVAISPAMVSCEGCLALGVKTRYCEQLCPIRPCALKKGYTSCAQCAKSERCFFLDCLLSCSPSARKNLRRARKK
jgi:hypothetical protein